MYERDKMTLSFDNGESVELSATDDDNPLAVYSNYVLQSAIDHATIANDDFKIKLAKIDAPIIKINDTQTATLNMDNYVNGDTAYTKFSFEDAAGALSGGETFKLNINIPTSDLYGLIMFYYIDDEYGAAGHYPARLEAIGGNVARFNSGAPAGSTYELTPGIQVMRLDNSVTALKVYADSDSKGTIIFGALDLVKGINEKLNYRYETGVEEPLDALLSQIAASNAGEEIAERFYYNAPIDSSDELEFNDEVADDNLANPLAWYDQNNVCNKFVVSEIDANYLNTGITLTKASKA